MCWLTLGAAPAFASAELEFAKGVVAFSQGNLEEAESHFTAVLSEDPQNVQAAYYLGQVAFGKNQLDRAIGLFRQVLALNPADSAVHLDLAQALVKAGRFADAEIELSAVAPAFPDRASVSYYLGYCRFQLERYADSLAVLEQAARLDQGFAAAAGYYLGLAHYRLGEVAEAVRQFNEVAERGGQEGISGLARQNLALLTEQRGEKGGKRWGLFASVGGGYDSNVALEATDTSNLSAGRAYLSIGAFGVPVLSSTDELQLSLTVFRSFYTTDESSGYDLTAAAAVARWRHRFDLGHRLELAYLLDLDLLDNLRVANPERREDAFGLYLHSHAGQVRYAIPEGRQGETGLEYQFSARFFDYDRRNCFEHQLLVGQDLRFLDDRLLVFAKAGVLVSDAFGQEFDLWGPVADIGATVWMLPSFSINVRGSYRHEVYSHYFAATRQDDRIGLNAAVSWTFLEHTSLQAGYLLIANASNTLGFDYRRHLVNAGLETSW